MKRISSLLLAFLLCVVFMMPVYASASEFSTDYISLKGSKDYSEIISMKTKILNEVNEIYERYYEGDKKDFATDVNFSSAYKIYVDTNIQDFELTTEQDILDLMNSSDYVWVIPFVISGKDLQVTLSKGKPLRPEAMNVLTEEEKAEVIANEGKWIISSISVDADDSLKAIASKMKFQNSYDNMVFIGGLPGVRLPIILAFKGGEAASWIPFECYHYPALEDESVTRSKTNGVYDYQTVLETCREYAQTADPDLAGGDGGVQASGQAGSKSEYTVLCTGGMLLIVAGIVFAAWKRNTSNKNHSIMK